MQGTPLYCVGGYYLFLAWKFEYLLSLSLVWAGFYSQDAHCVFREKKAMGRASIQCLVAGLLAKSLPSLSLVWATGLRHIFLSVLRDVGAASSKVVGHNHFLLAPAHSSFNMNRKSFLKTVPFYCQLTLPCPFLRPFLITWHFCSCHCRKGLNLVRD